MTRVAFAMLWVFVFAIPWELFVSFPGFGTIGRLLGVAAFGTGIMAVVLRWRVRPLRGFHIVMLCYVAWVGLTLYWTVDPEGTAKQFRTHLQLALFAWLVWELADTTERRRALLQAYVLGAYVSVADIVHGLLTQASVGTGRFAATGFNPNDLGFTLALALPLAWYLGLVERRPVLAWLNRAYVPVGMAAIALTGSRGAFIPAIAALLIVPLTLGAYRLRARLALGIALVVASGLLFRAVPLASWQRLATATDEIQRGGFGHRGVIWKAGYEAFRERPVAGFGAGAFSYVVEPYLGDARAPHQTFLSVLVGQGVIGLALFLGMFVAALRPVRHLPPLERKLWFVLYVTLAIGLLPRTWEYKKPLWLLLASLAASGGAVTAVAPARRRAVVTLEYS